MRSFLALCSLAVLAASPLAQIPRPNVDLDPLPLTAASGRAIASGGGITAQLFKDFATDDIYIVNSLDGGLTWSAPVKVDVTVGSKFMQADSIHIVGTDAHCGWSVTSPGGTAGEDDFAYSVVDVSGAVPVVTSPEILVAPSPLGFAGGQIREYEFEACMSPGGGANVAFLSLFDGTSGNLSEEVWVVTAPGGGAFTAPVVFNVLPTDADEIALACDGDDMAVTWVSNLFGLDDVFLSVNSMGGAPAGWSVAPVMVNTSTLDDAEADIDVDVKGGKLFVVWLQEILNLVSAEDEPFGRTFFVAGPASISPEMPLHSLVGSGGLDSDEIRCVLSAAGNPVAMFDYSTAGDVIYAATSTDCGMSYTETAISISTGSFAVMADGTDGVVAGAWSGGASPNTLESAYSCDDGVTWTTVADANTVGGDSDFSVIAYDSGKRNVLLGQNSDGLTTPPANDAYAGGYAVCEPATAVFRNTGGTNPASLAVSPILVGGTISATVDLTTTGHTMAILYAFDTPGSVVLGGGQELLCLDAASGELLTGAGKTLPGPMAVFSCPVPNDPCLSGLFMCMQAMHAFGVVPYALSNAYDVTVGSL